MGNRFSLKNYNINGSLQVANQDAWFEVSLSKSFIVTVKILGTIKIFKGATDCSRVAAFNATHCYFSLDHASGTFKLLITEYVSFQFLY